VGFRVANELTICVGFSLLSFWARIYQNGPSEIVLKGQVSTRKGRDAWRQHNLDSGKLALQFLVP
jgi:hypothetical protein